MSLDRYTFQARLVPIFIMLLPLGLAFLAVFPIASLVSAVLALLGTLSVQTLMTILLSEIGRDSGKKKEAGLFQKWGSIPTDVILSQKSTLDRATIERYKAKLKSFLPEIVFLTIEQEALNPEGALSIFRSCTNFLRERTRDKQKFALLFNENMSYGFRRNLWAMKPAGIMISLMGITVCMWALVSTGKSDYGFTVATVCLFINIVFLVWWILRITPAWVKIPADEYAKQLFAACEIM